MTHLPYGYLPFVFMGKIYNKNDKDDVCEAFTLFLIESGAHNEYKRKLRKAHRKRIKEYIQEEESWNLGNLINAFKWDEDNVEINGGMWSFLYTKWSSIYRKTGRAYDLDSIAYKNNGLVLNKKIKSIIVDGEQIYYGLNFL